MSATDPVAVDHAFNTLGTMNTRDVFRAVKRDMMDRRDVDSDRDAAFLVAVFNLWTAMQNCDLERIDLRTGNLLALVMEARSIARG